MLFCFISYRGNLKRLDRKLTPKTLHSILSDVIAQTGLTTAQHLAGHSTSAVTARYDRLWRENVQEAIDYRPNAPPPL